MAAYQTFPGLGSQNFPHNSRIASKSQFGFLCPVIQKLAQCSCCGVHSLQSEFGYCEAEKNSDTKVDSVGSDGG